MSRPRTFFIGLHPQMTRSTQQEETRALPYPCHYNLKMDDFLDKKACPSDFEGLTVRQQQNLLQYLDIYNEARGSDAHKDSTFGTVDVGRDPNLTFGSAITFDSLATLRTNNGTVWLLPAPQMQAVYGPKGRLVSLNEKCRMLGICPESVKGLSRTALETGIGNCISVQQMAVVMWPILNAWQLMKRDQDGAAFFNSDSGPEAEEEEEESSEEDQSAPVRDVPAWVHAYAEQHWLPPTGRRWPLYQVGQVASVPAGPEAEEEEEAVAAGAEEAEEGEEAVAAGAVAAGEAAIPQSPPVESPPFVAPNGIAVPESWVIPQSPPV